MARRAGRSHAAGAGRALTVVVALLLVLASAAAAQTPRDGLAATTIVSGLNAPTALAFLPDGRLVILEKGGAVRLWNPSSGLAPAPLLVLPTCTASEMGLLGVAVAPDFATSGHLFLYYTNPPGGQPTRCAEGSGAGRRNRIVRVTMSGDGIDPASLVVLLDGIRTDNGNHDGGGLRVGADGMLYVGVGDTGRGDSGGPGSATNPYAQDLDALEGKILRMTLAGEAPSDNPFSNRGGAADYVWAYGLRNPFRFSFDPISGRLWVADVGQNTFEEIDIVRAGDNLGWPQCEGRQPRPACPGDTVEPVHVYGHDGGDASITGGVFVTSGALVDTYVFADFVLDTVWSAALTPARDGFAGEPAVMLRNAGGPVDFAIGPDGALYYVAFQAESVVRVAGDGGSVSRGCAFTAGRVARRAMGRARAAIDACIAGGGGAPCYATPAVPPIHRALERRLGRACDPASGATMCAQLDCASCGTSPALAACIAAASSQAVATLAARVYGAGDGGCERALSRASVVGAGRRLVESVRCATGTTKACGPPPGRLRDLGGACRRPSDALCTALGCDGCNGREIAACGAAGTAAVADRLALRLAVGGE